MPKPLQIDRTTARRFALAATGIPLRFATPRSALEHLGFIQIDPINVCGRMHEHICRNRIENYQEGDLHRFLHGISEETPFGETTLPPDQRFAIEHFHPGRAVLAAFPPEAWPYLKRLMKLRAQTPGNWAGQLKTEEKQIATQVLKSIKQRGACGSEHFEHQGSLHNGWSNNRTVKVVLDKLFAHGRLLIARRLNGRRIYDLPERILPASILATKTPTQLQTDRWLALLKLRQHRLVSLTRTEFALVKSSIIEVTIGGCPPLFLLKEDSPLMESLREIQTQDYPPLLLAPLDPIILNRTITSKLWDFDYTWEVYTPPDKRVRGYYALPILANNELVGYVDPKADRKSKKLTVVSSSAPECVSFSESVHSLAKFLRLSTA